MWNDISVLSFSILSVYSTFQSCHSINMLLSVIKDFHVVISNSWFFVFIWLYSATALKTQSIIPCLRHCPSKHVDNAHSSYFPDSYFLVSFVTIISVPQDLASLLSRWYIISHDFKYQLNDDAYQWYCSVPLCF